MRPRNLFQDLFIDIQTAYPIIRKVAHHTPLHRSHTFSQMVGGEVYLKLESLQRTGSFKIRGAYYAISKLKDTMMKKGVITASAGNHAQGVAYAASLAGVKAIVVMPEFAPAAKIQATKGYGAEIVLYGRSYDEALSRAMELCKERNAVFLHSFNDPRIIAGQGTIGLELLEDIPDIEMIVVPVGGGGLIAGISVALRNMNPNIKIFGVQAAGASSMVHSFQKGVIVSSSEVDTIADGIAVKQPGSLTFEIIKELVDDLVTVDEEEISNAVFLLLERCKQVVEPAGAVGLAAVLSGKIDVKGKKVGVVISGGNINMSLLVRIIERSLYQVGRVVKISGFLTDRPGILKDVLTVVAKTRANVITIVHDRTDPYLRPSRAKVTITLEIPEKYYIDELIRLLQEGGYQFTREN